MKGLLFAFLIALTWFGVTEARAADPTGHAFCRDGIGSPNELATKVERSIAADPTGGRMLQGCAGTANHFLQAFKAGDPRATNLQTVADLPAYIRTLVPMQTRAGAAFNSSCLHDQANGQRVVVMNCVIREVRAGEVVYGNPTTRQLVLMSSCANPGVSEAEDIVVRARECVEVHFASGGVQVPIRFAYIGAQPLPNNCHTLTMAGQAPVTDYPEECPDTYTTVRGGRQVRVVCRWDESEAHASSLHGRPMQVQNVSGSFYSRQNGTNVLRLPRQALNGSTVICWELPNGQVVAIGVRRDDFVDGVATITDEHVRTLRYNQ